MAEEVVNLFSTGVIAIVATLIILVLVIVFLTHTQKRIKNKLTVKHAQVKRFEKFYNELEVLRLSKENSNAVFKKLDKHVKNILKEKFQLAQHTDYSSMMHIFNDIKKPKLTKFCSEMLKQMYSGEKLERKKINKLIMDFEVIVKEERIRPVTKLHRLSYLQ